MLPQRLLDIALAKIAKIYNLAKTRNVYAYQILLSIQMAVNKLTKEFFNEISKYRDIVNNLQREVNSEISFPTKIQVRMGFSNPLIYSFIHLLTIYDELMCQITLAKDMGAMESQNAFFAIKALQQKKLFSILTDIAVLSTDDIPNITIEQYLAEDECYKKALEQGREINPRILYNAINSTATPPLSAEQCNRVYAALKGMA